MMDKAERNALFKALVAVVKEQILEGIRPFTDRLERLETRLSALPEPRDGKDGRDGKDIDPEDIRQMVRAAVALIPTPENGRDGAPGKDAEPIDMRAIEQLIDHRVALSVGAIPKPRDGKDAEPVDLNVIERMVQARVAVAISELPAAKDGEPGRDGKDGESVHPDTVALMVHKEVLRAFSDMPKPKDGETGQPGRDALQIEITPFNAEKSYTRGTYISHNAGTWFAVRQTIPGEPSEENGWQMITCGLLPVAIIQGDDPREITITVMNTAGKTTESHLRFPVPHWVGIYQSGQEYKQGDWVTKSGSVWHCIVESTKASPGDSKDWVQVVMRGKDGKDLRPEDFVSKEDKPIRLK